MEIILKRFGKMALLVAAIVAAGALPRLSEQRSAEASSTSSVPISVIVCDGVNTGTVRLSTVPVVGRPSYATRAWVQSVGDWFILQPIGVTAPIPLVHVTASDGRHWAREFIPNPEWLAQSTWSIDESNSTGHANDENTGIDDTHPLLNIDELVRRVGFNGNFGTKVVRWLSDTTHVQVNLAPLSPGSTPLAVSEDFPVIIFVGVPTILRSGTLTGATDAPWTVTDSTLPVSWSSSGLVSSSSGTRLIRKTDKTKHAFIAYENSARTAQTSPTNGFVEDLIWFPFGTPAVSFAPGDAYEVLSLPKFPRVTPPDYSAAYGAAVFQLLDMDGVLGGQVEIRNCGFRQVIPDFNANTRSGTHQFHGAIFVQGFIISSTSASNSMDRVLMMGQVTMGTYNGDMNTHNNVIAKDGRIFVVHASSPRLGTIYAYDTTFNPVIQLSNNSMVTLDALHGSGNAGVLVDVRDSGCSVNSRSATSAFDATTSAAHPITVVGATKDYANLPFWSTIQNAGFVVN